MPENNETLSGLEVTTLPGTETPDREDAKKTTDVPSKPKATGPSVRTLKKNIKDLKAELDEKDLELQAMTDKAVIFQDQANELKKIIADIKRGNDNSMATVRGALVNAVNILDVLGGK